MLCSSCCFIYLGFLKSRQTNSDITFPNPQSALQYSLQSWNFVFLVSDANLCVASWWDAEGGMLDPRRWRSGVCPPSVPACCTGHSNKIPGIKYNAGSAKDVPSGGHLNELPCVHVWNQMSAFFGTQPPYLWLSATSWSLVMSGSVPVGMEPAYSICKASKVSSK